MLLPAVSAPHHVCFGVTRTLLLRYRFEVSLSHPSPHELASVRITTYIQFALVPFLQLSFRPGPDEAIKQLLATQIRDLKV